MLNETKSTKPAAFSALEELEKSAVTPDDHLQIEEWKKEIGDARAKALSEIGGKVVDYVEVGNSGNAIVPKAEVAEAIQQGHDLGPTPRRA